MKKTSLSLFGATAMLAALLSTSAQAAFISGQIDFSGPLVLGQGSPPVVTVGTNLSNATGVVTWISPSVSNATLDFDTFTNDVTESFPGDLVTITAPWVFNFGGPAVNFWSVGGFTFSLASSMKNPTSTATFLDVSGSGTISGNGFDATPGIWQFNITSATQAAFSFQSSSTAVPEGGSAVAMLGMGLLGLAAARKKLVKTA